MKKLSKILVFVLAIVVALSAFVIASSAQSAPFLVEGLYRDSWEDAIANAYIDGDRVVPVELLRDYEVGDGESIEITESLVIDLNGYALKSETGDPLFIVSGEDTELTIVGPGSITVAGTLVEVESGTLIIDASEELKITSTDTDSVFVVGGYEKAYATVKGALEFETAMGGNLFDLAYGAEFKLESGNSITADAAAGATEAGGIFTVYADAMVNINGGSLISNAGYIFAIGDDTDEYAKAVINCENAFLASESQLSGAIIEAEDAYANVSIRLSEVLASGGAFSAADTLADFEGDGKDKVYAKPTTVVNFTASTYAVSDSANANACLFYGNITGVVAGAMIKNSASSAIAIGTRLWDGECGVYIKQGNKFINTVTSETLEPLTDADGATVYFNPQSTTNKNFSLDTIDGEPCVLVKKVGLINNNESFTYYVVGLEGIDAFIDSDYSSNFEDPDGKKVVDNVSSTGYGKITYDTIDDNRFFTWLYDKDKKDDYKYAISSPYFELSAGGAGGTKRGYDAVVKNEFITWDFDIASVDGTYSYASLKMFIRPKGDGKLYKSYAYTDNFGGISGAGVLTLGGKTYTLPKEAYAWTHVTLILHFDYSDSFVNDEGVTCYPNLYKSKMYAYVNGTYLSTSSVFNANLNTEEGISRTSELSLDSIRFGLKSRPENADTSVSICLDNNIMKYYPAGYEGAINKIVADNTLSLTDAIDVVYRTDYYKPGEGQGNAGKNDYAVANVDGIDYYNMSEALKAISEGSVVYLYDDVEGTFEAKSSFTVYTDYKFDVVSDSYYLSEIRNADGEVIGYKTAPASKFVTVYWQVNMGYETKASLGIIPVYDGITPSPYYDNGRYFELVGWSRERDAKVPDAIGKVTKEDLIKGYIVYYPVFAPTKVLASFVDDEGKELYSNWYAEGETPDYSLDAIPGYKDNGKYIATVGWSTIQGADVPNAAPITFDDLWAGAKVFYSVKGIQKVEVKFFNEKNEIIQTEWINVGTKLEDLSAFNDGSSFKLLIDDEDPNFNYNFTNWVIDGGLSAIGDEPVNVTPNFDTPVAKDIKYSYLVERLTQFVPQIYVNIPNFVGFSVDGVCLLTGGGVDSVKIGATNYTRFNTGAMAFNYVTVDGEAKTTYLVGDIITKNEFTVYVHFTYNGNTYAQKIVCNFNDYIDTSIQNALATENESTLKALIETLRLVDNFAKLAGKEALPVCAKYLGDENYTALLTDLSTVSSLISDATKEAIEKNLNGDNGLYTHFLDNVRWDFVNNNVYFSPNVEAHVNITNGYNKDDNKGDFFHASANNRFDTTLYKTDAKYTYYATEGASSAGTLRGGIQGTFVLRINTTSYGIKNISALANSSNDRINIKMQSEAERKDMFNKFYSLSTHILELERRSTEDADVAASLAAELKMAQIIYATHYAYGAASIDTSGKSVDLTNLG